MARFDKNTNTVIFRSSPDKYKKEYDGRKCNTVRKYSTLESEIIWAIDSCIILKIKIINTETNDSFERIISDIEYFNNTDVVIFSWYHQNLTYR